MGVLVDVIFDELPSFLQFVSRIIDKTVNAAVIFFVFIILVRLINFRLSGVIILSEKFNTHLVILKVILGANEVRVCHSHPYNNTKVISFPV